ncbi:MAG: hypothetical protein DRQ63_09370 [Gammaproteobacteria bacterium]|nr:MAG: hypothetical protein DRQ63_09370 [Gammaproteobacteria bacterium]
MRINIKKLQDSGFSFEIDKAKENVFIQADQDNPRARAALNRLTDTLNFNDSESDDVHIAVNRIATMRAIRIASGG